MTCPSELVCSMYVDAALSGAEALEVERHSAACPTCGPLIAALAAESQALRAALQTADEAVAIPPFRKPLGALDLLGLGAGIAVLAMLVGNVWQGFRESLPGAVDWFNAFTVGELWNLAVDSGLFLINEGTEMIAATVQSISVAMLAATFGVAGVAMVRRRAGAAALLSVLLLVIVMPSLGHALEIRRDEALLNVAAGETIDDSVAFFGNSVAIDGNVNGDVIAFARNVIVRGDVSGDLIGFAETVTVEGEVRGNVFGFGRNVALVRAQVRGNLYGFGRDVIVANGTDIDGNATMFGNSTAMRGRVGVDLTSFSSDHEISGEVVRNAEAYAGEVRLLASARVGGNLTTHVGHEDDVQTASGATIGGATEVDIVEGPERRNRYSTAGFYVRQAVGLAGSFVAGMLLLWIFPVLRSVTLGSAGTMLKDAGIGLITLIAVPIAAVILCITIVGIPLGILAFIAWLIGLYFAKIILSVVIGRALFATPSRAEPHHAALLLAGLVVVVIVINLPFVGWLLNFVLTIVGLGLLVSRLIAATSFGQRVGI